MTVQEQLAELARSLSDHDAKATLEYVQSLVQEKEVLTPEEWTELQRSGEDLARGDYLTLDELLCELGR